MDVLEGFVEPVVEAAEVPAAVEARSRVGLELKDEVVVVVVEE